MDYELYHHGILGMHWGIRRYQNKDGSLTAAGRKRYEKLKENTRESYQNKGEKAYLKSLSEQIKFVQELPEAARKKLKEEAIEYAKQQQEKRDSKLSSGEKKLRDSIVSSLGFYDPKLNARVDYGLTKENAKRFLKNPAKMVARSIFEEDGSYDKLSDNELRKLVVMEKAWLPMHKLLTEGHVRGTGLMSDKDKLEVANDFMREVYSEYKKLR